MISYRKTGSSKTSLYRVCSLFVSGKIAKTGDDSMVVETPVASIGIRGTTVAGRAAQEGEQNTIALLRDADGGVGQITISNGAGIQTLTQPGQAVTLTSFTQPPSASHHSRSTDPTTIWRCHSNASSTTHQR